MVQAGRFRERIEIQTNTQSRDLSGGTIDSWITTYYARAQILGLLGKEYYDAQQVQSSLTHKIKIRHVASDITPSNRIKWGSRIFNIQSVIPDRRNFEINIMAIEEIT